MNSFLERAKELVSKMSLGEKISQMLNDSPAIPRLGIPAYNWWNECLHGVARAGVATVFPQAIGLAASFDTALMGEVATAISNEARAKHHEFQKYGDGGIYKGLTFWSPNINIFRDPRWGRGHETYGEDPYLTGSMGVAFVKGLQGDDPHYRKLDATIKHFAVHSGPEADRHHFNAVVSQKDLYETYLPAFKQCIEEAHPAAVMGAYNRVNGEACCASVTLLGKILRHDWGFDGYVVSDCSAICDLHKNHGITRDEVESAALAVNCGCELNCGHSYRHLMTAVERGLIMEETITHAVELLFETRFRLGMFDERKKVPYASIPYEAVDSVQHRVLARKMAAAGTVLLKNNGILPLDKEIRSIAVIGPNADDRDVLLGNYNGTPSEDVTVLDGIREHVSEETTVTYAVGCHLTNKVTHFTMVDPTTEALIAADRSDVVVFVCGLSPRMEGEQTDAYSCSNSGDKYDIELPEVQKELFDKLCKRGKPIIVVNISGSAVALRDANEKADAVLQAFYPGEEGGSAIADILFGDEIPSGRLPVTFYKQTEDLPPFDDYSMQNRTYRYFQSDPLYPFGFGLSYTTFDYSNLCVSDMVDVNSGIELCVDVKNTGELKAKEIVQVYAKHLTSPYEVTNYKLVAFTAVELKPGETKTVTMKIAPRRLAVIDHRGKAMLAKGETKLWIGGSQPDDLSRKLTDGTILEAVTLNDKETEIEY